MSNKTTDNIKVIFAILLCVAVLAICAFGGWKVIAYVLSGISEFLKRTFY